MRVCSRGSGRTAHRSQNDDKACWVCDTSRCVCILGSMSLHTRRQKKETFVGSCFAVATYVLLFCLCATCDMYFIVCIIHFAIRDVDYRLLYMHIYMCIYIYTKAFAESHKHSVISIAAVCSAQGWPFLLAIVADKNPTNPRGAFEP